MDFLMGSNIFHGFGFGMSKPDGFRPVAIDNQKYPCCLAQREWMKTSLLATPKMEHSRVWFMLLT